MGNDLRQEFDIAVLGAGPAGAVAAIALARFGYRVALIGQARRFPSVEGIADRAVKGLEYASCRHALAQANTRARRHAEWNGAQFAGNEETLVERAAFDAALRIDAAAMGVAVFIGRTAAPVKHGDGWTVAVGADFALASRFVIEARGRAAPSRATLRGPLTIALSRVWHFSTARPPTTAIAALPDGWAWFANAVPTSAVLQFFVSAEHAALPPRPQLADFYRGLLDAAPAARAWIADATADGPVRARQAQPQLNAEVIGADYARVGDAAFAIDPLSGHGIYEAVGGALALAAAVNTILARPAAADVAKRFYRERIAGDFWRMARIGRDFYRQEESWPERPFWRERSAWPDTKPAHAAPAGTTPRIEQRPVNVAGFIEAREVIVTPDHPRGVWQVAGVALAPLLSELRSGQSAGPDDIASHFARRHGLRAQDCQAALAWLVARGLIPRPPRRGG